MSELKVTTLSNQSGVTVPVDTVISGTAKAWVNFNGTGTVAIRRAFNVSSISDVGTGSYTVNFTIAMVDANYTAVGNAMSIAVSANRRLVVTAQGVGSSDCFSVVASTNANIDADLITINYLGG